MTLTDFKALTFDCYGTLIDWEAGILAELGPWAKKAGLEKTDDELLEVFGAVEHEEEVREPTALYREILRRTHAGLARRFGVAADEAAAKAFGLSVERWPAFPDSREALAYLKGPYRLFVISNVDRASFAFSDEKLGRPFTQVVTAEDVGSYKPDRRNFEAIVRAVEGHGIAKTAILHTAQSLYHDIAPGRDFGLATCWINRRHAKKGSGATPPTPGAKPDMEFPSLAALAEAHRRALKG